MKWKQLLTGAMLIFALNIASAETLNGPVGTACGGTTTAGTTMTGTQGWSTNPATGQGYWSCCQAGTSCVGRDKAKIVREPMIDGLVPVGTQPTKQTKSEKKNERGAPPPRP